MGPNTVLAPGPQHSKNDRSLALKIDPRAPDGFLVFSHAGDDWRECRDHVRALLKLPPWQPGDEQRRLIPRERIDKWDLSAIEIEADEDRKLDDDQLCAHCLCAPDLARGHSSSRHACRKISEGQRLLELPETLGFRVLRYHPRCPWRNEATGATDYVPALLAPFRSIDDDGITAIQRIALNPDGTKRGRRMLGIVRRTAIKFDDIGSSGELVVGEGVETCMAARQLGLARHGLLAASVQFRFYP